MGIFIKKIASRYGQLQTAPEAVESQESSAQDWARQTFMDNNFILDYATSEDTSEPSILSESIKDAEGRVLGGHGTIVGFLCDYGGGEFVDLYSVEVTQ